MYLNILVPVDHLELAGGVAIYNLSPALSPERYLNLLVPVDHLKLACGVEVYTLSPSPSSLSPERYLNILVPRVNPIYMYMFVCKYV